MDQQEQVTETATPEVTQEVTNTVQPSETPSLQATQTETATPTPTLEPPTATFPAATSTEEPAAAPPIGDQSLAGEFAASEVLIRFRKRATQESIQQCVQSVNASIASEIDELQAFVLSVPPGSVAESLFNLASCPDLRYAEPNYLVQVADLIPSDPGWGSQYGLTNIRAPQGWELTTGSDSVTIAILDTGIDYTHPDLAGKVVGGIDLINGDNDAWDDSGHGTHVAGIAGAIGNNGLGVAGVSWGARLMPVKVLNALGRGTYAGVANGIIWAADHGAQVINLSLGGYDPSQVLQDAVDYAASQGVVIVAATGNDGREAVMYPARYSNVIAVAATNASNHRAAFSNYGPEVDLAAPGASIYSTELGGYNYHSGTSMAAPFVSGLAAILRGASGNASPAAILQQMETTALDVELAGWDAYSGYGLIQMDAAIRLFWSPSSVSFPTRPGGFVTIPTSSPTSTETPLPAQPETATASPTLIAPEASPSPPPEGGEVIALETSTPAASEEETDLFQPCLAVLLIVLGMILFWLANRQRKKDRRNPIYFR